MLYTTKVRLWLGPAWCRPNLLYQPGRRLRGQGGPGAGSALPLLGPQLPQAWSHPSPVPPPRLPQAFANYAGFAILPRFATGEPPRCPSFTCLPAGARRPLSPLRPASPGSLPFFAPRPQQHGILNSLECPHPAAAAPRRRDLLQLLASGPERAPLQLGVLLLLRQGLDDTGHHSPRGRARAAGGHSEAQEGGALPPLPPPPPPRARARSLHGLPVLRWAPAPHQQRAFSAATRGRTAALVLDPNTTLAFPRPTPRRL
jgi:hypothetical protein